MEAKRIRDFLEERTGRYNIRAIIPGDPISIPHRYCQPAEFIMHCSDREPDRFEGFVHRTFNGSDCRTFMDPLRYLYREKGGLGHVFQYFFPGTFSREDRKTPGRYRKWLIRQKIEYV